MSLGPYPRPLSLATLNTWGCHHDPMVAPTFWAVAGRAVPTRHGHGKVPRSGDFGTTPWRDALNPNGAKNLEESKHVPQRRTAQTRRAVSFAGQQSGNTRRKTDAV